METKNFEINGEFRAMDMAELAYILTNYIFRSIPVHFPAAY